MESLQKKKKSKKEKKKENVFHHILRDLKFTSFTPALGTPLIYHEIELIFNNTESTCVNYILPARNHHVTIM